MDQSDSVLVRRNNTWATGIVGTPNYSNPETGQLEHHIILDDTNNAIEAFAPGDVYLLPSYKYSFSKDRVNALTLSGPGFVLYKNEYTLDTIPSDVKANFRHWQVLGEFQKISQSQRLEHDIHIKYNAATDTVDLINTDHLTLVIQTDDPLPCPIRRISKSSSVLLRIKTATPHANLPKQLPRLIAGTFSLDMKDAGIPSPSLAGWVIDSASNLHITVRGARKLDFKLKPGVSIDKLVLTCYEWKNLTALSPNLSIKTLMLEDLGGAQPFSFTGLPPGIDQLAVPSHITSNFLSLLMGKHRPHTVRGFQGASLINPILEELRDAPKHERNQLIKHAIAELKSQFPRDAFTLRY
jgi:hypothetical protein